MQLLKDFIAELGTNTNVCTVTWKWANGHQQEQLKNTVLEYPGFKQVRVVYKQELLTLLNNGWLLAYSEKELGPLQMPHLIDGSGAKKQVESSFCTGLQ